MKDIIIHIDTALSNATVALSAGSNLLVSRTCTDPKETSAFVQDAIAQMFEETGFQIRDIAAVAITAGPGSYTGLRVGMASAKGICYALDKPLIALNTLKVMAKAAFLQADVLSTDLCIPMIDARRMEVFTAVYDHTLNAMVEPMALILEANSFSHWLNNHRCYCTGNGAAKFLSLVEHPATSYISTDSLLPAMSQMAYDRFMHGDFAGLAHAEPFYIKEFHSS